MSLVESQADFVKELLIWKGVLGISSPLNYLGVWDASTNTPTIVSSVGTANTFYVVDVAGTTTLDGISTWNVGDWVVFNGTVWTRIPALSSNVTPVNLTAHAGGGQGSGTAITAPYSRFTVVASVGDSGTMVAPSLAARFTIVNATTNAMNLFPPSGHQFANYGVNAAISINPFGSITITFVSGTTWDIN